MTSTRLRRGLLPVFAKAQWWRSRLSPRDDQEGGPSPGDSRVRFSAALLGALVLGAVGMRLFYSESTNLRNYAAAVETLLHEHEREIRAVAEDTAFLRRQVYGLAKLSPQDQEADAERILELSQRPFNVCLYERDSLVFWTNNRVFPPESIHPGRLPRRQLRLLKNGHYVVEHREPELFRGREFHLVTLVPIKNAYNLPSEYLRNTFLADPSIPDEVDLCAVPTAFPIRSADGDVVSYLHNARPFRDPRYQLLSFGMLLAGLLLVGTWLNALVAGAERRFGPWASGGVVVAGALAVQYVLDHTSWINQYRDLGLVAEVFDVPVLSGSLGGLLVNVLLVLWLVSFFHRRYKLPDLAGRSELRRFAVTTANYAGILLAALGLTHAFRRIVTDSALVFDFNNVLNLNAFSMIAVLAMLILMFGFFLLSHRLMLGIREIGLTRASRFGALSLAMAASLPVTLLMGEALPLPHFYAGAFVFVVVYDMFVDSGESNVLWLFFWLVVLAMYSAALLFTFNEEKDLSRRIAYAKTLSEPRDTTAETGLAKFVSALRGDIAFQEALASDEEVVGLRRIAPVFERLLIDEGYLYNNYSYRVFGYDAATDSTFLAGRGGQEARQALRRAEAAVPLSDHVGYYIAPGEPLHYVVRLASDLVREPTRSLILELVHEPRRPSRVFTELLVDERYRHLQALPEYDYAIYREGDLIEESGRNHALELRIPNLPQPGYFISATNSRYSSVLYAGDEDTVVLIGKDMGGYWRPMSLFSYLFVWCIMMTLVMSLLNTYVDLLPAALDITWLGKPDLKTKIQVGIVALVLLSFAMIGYVTVLYFHDSTDKYHDNRLNRKVASILRNTEHEIALLAELTEIDETSLNRIIKPISEIHRMDVNLYDRSGTLLSSSETDIFKRGVIAPKMGAYAYQMLEKRGRTQVVQAESVGDLGYRAAYVPIRMPGGETIAYMGLPYYSKQRDLRDDVSSFMGTLLNVYVFLLLIAGVIAISVANSITQPLSELGAKIRRFKVDNKNEPLEWKATDELGALIGEFNTMLATVEENAKELDNARREMAWREMAQQVAHEIKNPLTPMKLSIQFLRHAADRDPAEVQPLIERVSNTLVEQIDNLTTIATTFSTFARMPEPENTHFELDALVRSVYDLFLEEDVDSELDVFAGETYTVFADKKLLMRVLNNLIKNAIQAIPEGRRGRVRVRLSRRGDTAVIGVRDNGTGIPEDMVEKVFYPKFTTKSSGTGLGLAICRDIVKAAQGKIYFETEEGRGTEFFVELPVVEVAAEQLEAVEPARELLADGVAD